MAAPARYTEQVVIMTTAEMKAAIFAAAEQEEVSASESARRWLAAGMAADPATAMPHRLARVAEIKAAMELAEGKAS